VRRFDQVEPVNGRTVRIGEVVLVQCCSTQYLGTPWTLQGQEAIVRVLANASPSSWGAFGSNFLGGTHESRLLLEKDTAERTGYPAALAFASGWAANYALGEAIGRVCDLVVSDKRSHNSVIHGLRAGKSKVLVSDLNAVDVEAVVGAIAPSKLAVFSPALEGITGEHVSPVWTTSLKERSLWIRDDCHSFGALGQLGTEDFDGRKPDVRVLGFSKACGVMGAVVCSTAEFIDLLAQLAAPWIFSTAVPPILWEMNRAVLAVVVNMSAERAKILNLAKELRNALSQSGIQPMGVFHISGVPVPLEKLGEFESSLREAGYFVKVSQYPSRPPDDPCARVCFSPEHTSSDVTAFSQAVIRTLTT
jgi:8-amino-7-oxononanoate synthase